MMISKLLIVVEYCPCCAINLTTSSMPADGRLLQRTHVSLLDESLKARSQGLGTADAWTGNMASATL
jgi:hypothetical protein